MRSTWTIGSIMRSVREQQGITLQQLCRGICSPATLSRIEENERDMEFIMACILFERLGYTLDKFECYGSKEEFEQYEMRINIKNYKFERKLTEMEKEIKEYQNRLKRISPFQRQFLDCMNGFLMFHAKEYEKAANLLERSISISVVGWKGTWKRDVLLGVTEIEMLILLTNIYEALDRSDEADSIRWKVLIYLERKKECKGDMAKAYTEVVCHLIPTLLQKEEYQKGVYWCERALKVLSRIVRTYYWTELLYWKGKCLEGLLEKKQTTKQEVILTYQEAYYIAGLFEKKELQMEIEAHLKEKFQWESIK